MKQVLLILVLAAGLGHWSQAHAFGPPAGESKPAVIELFSVHEERADRISAEFTTEDPTCPNYDQRPQIVVPVTERDILVGYAFVTPRFCLARGVNRFQIDDDMHFIFDNMVRAAHRTPFLRLEDDTLDQSATEAALVAAAREILGDERLERIDLLGSDIRYMR